MKKYIDSLLKQNEILKANIKILEEDLTRYKKIINAEERLKKLLNDKMSGNNKNKTGI